MKTLLFVWAALSGAAPISTTTPSPPELRETIVVSAIRAEEETPVTKTDVPREGIEERYHGQDVPLLLRDTPSVNAWAESGVGGAGYSYISLRGVNATRINFTLDGVPLSDSEDMGAYFVDFPDLARSLESIQIQRGAGTSTFGTAAFAGSVNMESIALSQDSRTDATLGLGSHDNRQASVGYHSGALANGFAFYTRLSYLENSGYRDNSETRQRNVFFSGSKQLGDALLKLTGFSGHEDQQLSFYATDEATLEGDPRNNPLRPEEKDSFGYDLGQLQYIRPLGSDSDMTASVYYQRGYGWYRLFDYSDPQGGDTLRQYGLDGMLLGSIVTYSKSSGALTTNYGVHVNRFRRDHTRDDVAAGSRDYANYGEKGEVNAFAKVSYDAGAWHLYGDAQVRHSTFDYHGDVDIESIDWTFFNPKIGARYSVSAAHSVYASAGLSTREPTRNDMFLGEDNPSAAHDLDAVRPERLLDLELGWNYRAANLELAANLYAMELRNEIASTGELSEIGLLLRRNVDRSYRRGIELDAAWQPSSRLRLRTTANLSRNRISEWTQFFDVYDVEGNWTESRPVRYQDVEPLLTPSVIVSQSLDYAPNARVSGGLTARYVGRSYLDNTNDDAFDAPSFYLVDARASYAVTPWARVTLQVNNLLDANRVYPSGYSYRFYAGEVQSGTAYYYPQAGRNAVVLMDFDF
ncbi:MAG TPA: TonB-dependent receptor [Thermoanaerobaculia bacterium]|nr:TonB-dependent receptor [Thermoanaerobaculia bacterium]